jgi:hypothetical protein
VHKVRTGTRVTKTYDRAQTPGERLLASPGVAESRKAALRAELHCLDPCVLLAEIERLQEALWRLAKPDLLPTSPLATQPGSDPTRCAQSQDATPPSIEAQTPKRRSSRRAQRPRCPPTWRTRPDPFAAVWEEIQAQLVPTPEITAKALLHDLQSQYPGPYIQGQLRTLHRRVSAWRKQQAVQRLTPHLPQQHHAGQGLTNTGARTPFALLCRASGYPPRQCRQGQALWGRATRAALTALALRIKRYPCSARHSLDCHKGGRLCYLFPGQRQLEKVRALWELP